MSANHNNPGSAQPLGAAGSLRSSALLRRIEARRRSIDLGIRSHLRSRYDGEMLSMLHYATRSGKRLRGTLFLTLCEGSRPPGRSKTELAVSIELGHAASLVHDDIIDGAAYRRLRKSFWKRYGIKYAVLVPHLLISDALALAGKFGSVYVEMSVRAWHRASRGQYLDMLALNSAARRRIDYTQLIKLKSASLFECAASMGAVLSGRRASTVRETANLGTFIGLAYQVIDDLTDSVSAARAGGSALLFRHCVAELNAHTSPKLTPADFAVRLLAEYRNAYAARSRLMRDAALRGFLTHLLMQKLAEGGNWLGDTAQRVEALLA